MLTFTHLSPSGSNSNLVTLSPHLSVNHYMHHTSLQELQYRGNIKMVYVLDKLKRGNKEEPTIIEGTSKNLIQNV